GFLPRRASWLGRFRGTLARRSVSFAMPGTGELQQEFRMGLFATIRRHFRRREQPSMAARSYVDPALVGYVGSNRESASLPRREGKIEFLLALIDENDLARLPELFEQAVTVLRDAGGWPESFGGSLVFATFGTLPRRSPADPRQQRMDAAARLRER